MIELGRITQGERGTLTVPWELPDSLTSPASVLGAVITAVMQNLDTGAITAVTGTLTGTAAKVVTWALSAADSGTAAAFAVVFKAVVSGVATYTLAGTLVVDANPAVSATAAPPLVGIPSDDADWLETAAAGGALGTAAYQPTTAFDAAGAASTAQAAAIAASLQRASNLSDVANAATARTNLGVEAALGNPGTNGYLLSSTTGGTRSWVAPASGSGDFKADGTVAMIGTLSFNTGGDDLFEKVFTIPIAATNGSDIMFNVGYADFGGVRDNTFNIGFNQTSSGWVTAAKHSWHWQMEYDYYNNSKHWVEAHLNLRPPSGTGYSRPIEFKYNRDGSEGTIFTKASSMQHLSMTDFSAVQVVLGATAAASRYQVNSEYWVDMPLADGNAFLIRESGTVIYGVDTTYAASPIVTHRALIHLFKDQAGAETLRLETKKLQLNASSFSTAQLNMQMLSNAMGIQIRQAATNPKRFILMETSAGTELASFGLADAFLTYNAGGKVESLAGNMEIKAAGGYTILTSSKATTGDPTGAEGMIYINTFDNLVRMYADGAWRTLATW
jgi:hypothetical protein